MTNPTNQRGKRMARKLKITSALVAGTSGDDFIHGSNKALTPDTINAGAGDDTIKTYQGADTVSGGSGADKFIVDWPDSNAGADFGVDRYTDFKTSEGDNIDLSYVSHYSDADMAVAVSRKVNFGDVTLTPIAGGTHVHVEVVAGNPTWDIDIDVMSDEPLAAASFVFG